MLAIVRLEVCFLVASGTASVLALPLSGVNHGGRHDTRGNGDDGVAENHDDAREDAPDGGDGGDVAIAHSGEGNNGPIDAGTDVGELRVRLPTFDHEHEGAKNDDEDEDKKKIDKYLPEAETDALHEQIAFVNESEELQHSEDANETDGAQNEEVARIGEAGNEGDIEWQRSEQVDDAEETEGIVLASGRTVEAEDVLKGEEEGEHILKYGEDQLEPTFHMRQSLDKSNNEAEDDGNHDDNVEDLACASVGIGHDVVEARLVFQKCEESFHGGKIREKNTHERTRMRKK